MSFTDGQEARARVLPEPKQRQVHESEAVARSPAIGDVGIVVSVDAGDDKLIYTVESVATHGAELWLAQFKDDELE